MNFWQYCEAVASIIDDAAVVSNIKYIYSCWQCGNLPRDCANSLRKKTND